MKTTAQRDAELATYDNYYVGLLSAITNHRAPTVTELSYSGYARAQITLAAAGDTTPAGGRQRATSNSQSFGANGGSTVNAIGWGLYSASSGGSPVVIGYLGTLAPKFAVGTPTSEDIYCKGHGFAANQTVRFLAHPGAEMPAGLSENTEYHVIATGLTTDVFQVSATQGGSAVNITAQGAMLVMPYASLSIPNGATPTIATGGIVLQA